MLAWRAVERHRQNDSDEELDNVLWMRHVESKKYDITKHIKNNF